MIQINRNVCISCGKCAWDCFPGAIVMEDGAPALAAPENCIFCGHCVSICPVGAVSEDTLPGDDVIPARFSVEPGNLLDMMRSRRSCRHYRKDPVSGEDLHRLLSAARACPTAKNLQNTRYIAVAEALPKVLDLALEALGKVGQAQLETAAAPDDLRRAKNFIRWADQRKRDKTFDPLFFHAPLLLLFVSDRQEARDAAGAAAYVELMAASLGLGCLYSGYFTACAAGSQELRTFLSITDHEQVARCLVLGHPDVQFQRTAPRKPAALTSM